MLRYRTLERILEHIKAGELDDAIDWLERCMDWETRKAQYGQLMRQYRACDEFDEEQRQAYLTAYDRMP